MNGVMVAGRQRVLPFPDSFLARLATEFYAAQVFAASRASEGSAQRNAPLIIRVTVLCNQWASGPLHHMTRWALPRVPVAIGNR